ncbi:putative complex I intermediate-associated protein 30 [Rosellinia necatrix]|uniref:Putative complex I intermediate-associated protein 30 n=1 Tax=Rosellinia necatrix TaxID=77044 RepID=A0A1W2TV11_ROSNE|nr:putative complex I intermediate-associated protein 30 [Rosellinia necatrix]
MRATASCLSKGFWGRSIDEFKRLSNLTFKLEGIKGPSGPLLLHDFHSPDSIKSCKTLSDRDIGGYSDVALDWVSQSKEKPEPIVGPGYARFHGTISTELPPAKEDIKRSGYAAWRTLDPKATIFGKPLFNIDMYTYLALRVRSDGRSYLINLQTESVVPTDLHQHRLFAKRPGEWETVLVKWNDFVRTNHGFVIEPQTEMLRQKVRTVGIGLTDRVPGPFNLCIERIWATNDMRDGDETATTPSIKPREGQLKNKQGQHIKWSDS